MRIAVCMVMVPRNEEVFVHRATGKLRAEPTIANPADENALELALRIKDSEGAEVVAVSCGGDASEAMLRKAIALGCDHAYHLKDEKFERSDSLATARILGEALKRIKPDLSLFGAEALNGGQTGPRVAEHIDVPHVIEVTAVDIGDPPRVKRMREGAEESVRLSLPALLAVRAGINMPRMPKAVQIMKAHREGVLTRWTMADLGLDESSVGEKGSGARLLELFD